MKKTIKFCLYSIIAFSTIDAMCSEKKEKLNRHVPLQIYYNFLNINTLEKYNIAANKLATKFIENVIIECDICAQKTTGILAEAYNKMLAHRDDIHQVCKYNNVHETSNCISNPSLQEISVAKTLENFPLILNFSSVDTEEKYKDISDKLSQGIHTFVTIICNQKNCIAKRGGMLGIARSNMIYHLKKDHLICKCGAHYESITQIQDCKNCFINNINTQPNNIQNLLANNIEKIKEKSFNQSSNIYYNFKEIDSPNKYDKAADKLKYGKTTKNIIIKCNICNVTRKGQFNVAYSNMLSHRQIEHKICKFNKLHQESICTCQIKPSFIHLKFSSIDTQKKYIDMSSTIAGKVIISCNQNGCPVTRRGILSIARANIIYHLKTDHLICRCGIKHESFELLENCNSCINK